jgi:hypothetical protein
LEKAYVEQSSAEIREQLAVYMNTLDKQLTPEDFNAQLILKYRELSQAESEKIDAVSSSLEQSLGTKLKVFWRKHAKARLVLGAGLFGAGMLLTFTGVGAAAGMSAAGAGLAITRGVTSGAGAAMGIESLLDTHTEILGKKGKIDDLLNIGFRGKKGGWAEKYLHREGAEITEEDKADAIAELTEKADLKMLEQERARLRILGLDKAKGMAESGRFGQEQILMVEAIEEVYQIKLQEHLQELLANKEEDEATLDIVNNFIGTQQEVSVAVLQAEQHSSRNKAMARATIALTAGITVGMFTGGRMWEKFAGGGADATGDAAGATTAAAESGEHENPWDKHLKYNNESAGDAVDSKEAGGGKPAEDLSQVDAKEGAKPATEQAPAAIYEATHEVAKGDNVWNIIENQLRTHFPDWNGLNEAQQTYFIDYFENRVVADPAAYGIEGDINNLTVGSQVNFGELFDTDNINEAAQKSGALTTEQMSNIVDNNEAIATAAKDHIRITSENVDGIAREVRQVARDFSEQGFSGTEFIDKSGEIQDWTYNGDPVEVVPVGGQDVVRLVDSPDIIVDKLDQVIDHQGNPMAEAAAEVAPDVESHLNGFLEGTGEYSEEVYKEAIKDPKQLDQLVDHVFNSDRETQIAFLEDFDVSFDPENNKGPVFLKVLENQDIEYSSIDSVEELTKYITDFDQVAHGDELPGKLWEARLLKDEDGRLFYALVQKIKNRLLSQDSFMIDEVGPTQTIKTKQLAGWLIKSEAPLEIVPEAAQEVVDAQAPEGVPEAGTIDAEEPVAEKVETPVKEGMTPEELKKAKNLLNSSQGIDNNGHFNSGYFVGNADHLKQWPAGVTTEFDGSLDLSDAKLETLPDNFKLNGSLDLRGSQITNIPDDAQITREIFVPKDFSGNIPEHLQDQIVVPETTPEIVETAEAAAQAPEGVPEAGTIDAEEPVAEKVETPVKEAPAPVETVETTPEVAEAPVVESPAAEGYSGNYSDETNGFLESFNQLDSSNTILIEEFNVQGMIDGIYNDNTVSEALKARDLTVIKESLLDAFKAADHKSDVIKGLLRGVTEKIRSLQPF